MAKKTLENSIEENKKSKNNKNENNKNKNNTNNTSNNNNVSKEELIGYHKGALTTLSKERAELQRLLQIVEQLMKHHIVELKNLGVDITKQKKE